MHIENRSAKNGNKHSCLFIIAIGAFAGLVGLLLAYQGFKAYVISNSTNDLSPADKKKFLEWAHTPVDIIVKQSAGAENIALIEAKAALKGAALATDDAFPQINQGIIKQILAGKELTAEESDVVSSFTRVFMQVLPQVKAVAGHDNYVLNDRVYPSPPRSSTGWSFISSLFCVYIYERIAYEDWDAAIAGLDLVAKLSRCDSDAFLIPLTISWIMKHRAYGIVANSTDNVPDPATLGKLLDTLSGLKVEHDLLSLDNLYPWISAMKQDGYITLNQITPARVRSIEYKGYLEWLTHNLPNNSPRRSFATEELNKHQASYGSGPAAGFLKQIDAGLVKPLIRPLIALNSYPELVAEWKFYNNWKNRLMQQRVKVDLLQLHIAMRLANDNDVTADIGNTVIEKYLKPVANDPFTSGTYSYSDSENCYYSVGPDGKAETDDDITGLPASPVSGD